MLEYLFGTSLIEKILFYLLINEKCYSTELKKLWNTPLYGVQRALSKLEKGGLLISYKQGKTVVFVFNPNYIFLPELLALLKKAYSFLPDNIRVKYYEPVIRKRPRRHGKPI